MKPYILNASKKIDLVFKYDLSEPSRKDFMNDIENGTYKSVKRLRKQQRFLLKLEKRKARHLLKIETKNYGL